MGDKNSIRYGHDEGYPEALREIRNHMGVMASAGPCLDDLHVSCPAHVLHVSRCAAGESHALQVNDLFGDFASPLINKSS